MDITSFLHRINLYILNPIIALLFALALVVFLFGVFQFILKADDAKSREVGKSSIMWGLIGMFIMFAVFKIIGLLLGSVGVSVPTGIIP